jgi:hypothetical protein
MQQDLEDKKNEIIIEGLEKKIKDHEGTLEKKDFILQTMEGSLVEAQAEIARLNSELSMEKKNFEAKLEAEDEKNSNLRKSLKELQEKCVDFGNQCLQRLKQVFNSIGASADKFSPSVENLPETFEHIEGEVDALDEVIASRGTAAAFMKSGCTHGNIVNRPNFSLSPADLIDIPSLAQSIGNRFITQIWVKGGRKMAGDEARSHLKPVKTCACYFTFFLNSALLSYRFNMYRMTMLRNNEPKLDR